MPNRCEAGTDVSAMGIGQRRSAGHVSRGHRLMRCSPWRVLTVLLLALWHGSAMGLAQEPPDPLPADAASGGTSRPDQFAGQWLYNSEDSRNIATGRPERGPRGSAPPRPVLPRAPAAGRGAGAVDTDRTSPFSPSPAMIRENRDLARDLLEIAETLTFGVSDEVVTITDDLDRARTFPTDNSRERYRLGASEFWARVRWEEGRLRRDIEGSYAFRLTETYLLSADASRLFVIIRVGSPARGRPRSGVDRVYDRIVPEEE